MEPHLTDKQIALMALAGQKPPCQPVTLVAGGFILSVGCDFPREVPLANIRALMSLKDWENV